MTSPIKTIRIVRQGPAGARGPAGLSNAFAYAWVVDTAASDPGAGKIKANNAAFASITEIYISEIDAAAADLAAEIGSWADGTSSVLGKLKITAGAAHLMTFDVTGVAGHGGWQTLTVIPCASCGMFSPADDLFVSFLPKGDKGETGPPGAIGPQGATGPQGVQGATGPQGAAGPLTADVTTEDVAGTSYTIVAGDLGKRKRVTNGSSVTVTLPNDREQGFSFLLCQAGPGQVTFSPASGATLRNRGGYTKTAGQWSEVSLTVDSNAGGTSASWVLSGDVGP
jgi:hypothetical protein